MGGRRIISHSRYKILLAVLGFLVLMSNTILDTKISDGNNSTPTLFQIKPCICYLISSKKSSLLLGAIVLIGMKYEL